MGARWEWQARCNTCGCCFTGFSGGPDNCHNCGSDNVVELWKSSDAEPANPMRTFETGATRDGDTTKLDYEGFLSPAVLRRFAEYMHKHRIQPDGELRASDNWQKGIPFEAYMKSLFRHFMDVWSMWRDRENGYIGTALFEEALCAMLFNVQGLLFEALRDREIPIGQEVPTPAEVGNPAEMGRAGLLADPDQRPEGLEAGVDESKQVETYNSPCGDQLDVS